MTELVKASPSFIYGTAWKKDATADLVRTAVLAGFKAIDTANQAKHYSEPLLGEALETLATDGIGRESLFVQTKFTPLNGQDHRLPYDPKADLATQVRQSFASSLQHLKTSYVDSFIFCMAHILTLGWVRKTGKYGAQSKKFTGRAEPA